MKITFVIPGLCRFPGGGAKIVFEYANRLADRGHSISIVFWCGQEESVLHKYKIPTSFKYLIYKTANCYYPRWFHLNRRIKKICTFSISNSTIPSSDWIFATAVETAVPVSLLSTSKGKKGYLIQDFECWKETCEYVTMTYKLGMYNIVISKWLQDLVEEYAPETSFLISNPVDTSVFFDDGIGRNPNQVSVLYHIKKYKGFPDVFKALLNVKKVVPNLQVEIFGTYEKPDYFPDWFHYTRNASPNQLRRIYSSSSLFVCASIKEGFGLTGLEALACGCPLVSTDYEGVRDYAVNFGNSVLSPVNDSSSLASNIIRVLDDKTLAARLGKSGINTAQQRSWDVAINKFEGILFG